jgi:3-oxoacyl-[acyl-carrier protein] reductase
MMRESHDPEAARFAGRVALVTGASRGIGLAIARRIIADGGRVCITARKPEPLATAISDLGGPDVALAVAGKADDPAHQEETVRRTIEVFGRLDVLVNNTGINPAYGPMMSVNLGAARKVLDVNLLGALAWTQHAYWQWMSQHGGSVVNVASVAGLKPADGLGLYGASKAALIYLTQQIAWELAPAIRVNAVAPAVVRTVFAATLFEGREEEVIASYPARRLGEPDDVADAVAYLASDAASWITGHTLVIDGGVSLRAGV